MSPEEAKEILKRLRTGEAKHWRSQHFQKRLKERRYSILSVYHLLHHGVLAGGPEFHTEYNNHVVRLEGTTLDERHTRLVLGLRSVGESVLITIVDLTPKPRGKKK